MKIDLRFFATFREVVGQKELVWESDTSSTSVGELLSDLVETYPELEFFDESGDLRPYLSILKNGRDITFLAQLDTELTDGDVLSIFPPVAGGGVCVHERTYRGISPRAARLYLTGLGGKVENDSYVVGNGWHAEISDTKTKVGPTLELTEVSIRFEGDPETLKEIVELFSRKAMRAGG